MKKIATLFLAGGYLYAGAAFAEGAQALFETKCSDCHELSRPLGKNKDRDGWTATVNRMQGKKPGWISGAEAEEIIGYLVKERGPAAGR